MKTTGDPSGILSLHISLHGGATEAWKGSARLVRKKWDKALEGHARQLADEQGPA